MSTIILYRHPLSGHAHRAEVFMSLLGLPYELVDVDLAKGAHKQSDFLVKNPFGQVPVIEDRGLTVSDSNAILVYLASRYDDNHTWLPQAPEVAADVQRFLSLAAGSIANGPAAARLVNVFGAKLDHDKAIATAHQTLEILDSHLAQRDWLVGDSPTIADVANYTYIAHAPEGDVSLESYTHIRAWLGRFEALEGFVPMKKTAVGLSQ